MSRVDVTQPARKRRKKQLSWSEKTLASICGAIEQSVFTEEHTRKNGWLQGVDPRAKVGMFLLTILATSLSNSLLTLLGFYLLLVATAYASKLPFDFFVKRVWLGIPLFAGIVIIPSIFFTPGGHLFDLALGSLHLGPSLASLHNATLFVLRVGVSVSLAVLLVVTTPWADLLKSLHALCVPQIFILLLSMTYRYIFLFLRTTTGLFEARKSRIVGYTSGNEQRRWISGSIVHLLNRSFQMSNDVYTAMLARGFTGEARAYSEFRMTTKDWLWLVMALLVAGLIVLVGRYVR